MTTPIVVYTCVTGDYDSRIMPAPTQDGVRFVCFTDNAGRLDAPGWEMRPLASPRKLVSGHYINRFHKFFPHRLFPQDRWSVYLDGNVTFAGDFAALVRSLARAGAGIGGFWHPRGNTLEQEIALCRFAKFDRRDMAVVDEQVDLYRTSGIEFDQPIITNNLLVRDHHASGFDLAMSLWWAQIAVYTQRDQVSLPYVLASTGLKQHVLDGEGGIDRALVQVVLHDLTWLQRLRWRLRRQFGYVPG